MNWTDENQSIIDWTSLDDKEKKRQLFLKQKEMLEIFLEHNAITKEQFEKSYNDLKDKMGM